MLLTLNASCLRPLLAPPRKKPEIDLLDLPILTRETLGLAGVNLTTDLLAGADRTRLARFRERADKAGCACLLLIEPEAQPFGSPEITDLENATARMLRVVEAAQILGCSAASVRVQAKDDDEVLSDVASHLRPVVERAEKLDLNLLVAPMPGLTERPERVTELIKRVGGFRIGTFPDFETASKQKDPSAYLHRLTPYATVVSASTVAFAGEKPKAKGKTKAAKDALPEDEGVLPHDAYDLRAMLEALDSVGYGGPLALDYRGDGEVTIGVIRSRDALQAALDAIAAGA